MLAFQIAFLTTRQPMPRVILMGHQIGGLCISYKPRREALYLGLRLLSSLFNILQRVSLRNAGCILVNTSGRAGLQAAKCFGSCVWSS